MEKEMLVLSRLSEKFSSLDRSKAAVSPRRIFLHVPSGIFMDVLRFAQEELDFYHLCTITGLDTGTEYEFIYHISNHDGIVLNLKLFAPREDSVIASILPIYPGATFYELELQGLLGVKVEGLPEGRQYPLPDNWPKGQHPLRKDWVPDTAVKER
jgi:membrane-bound hydrogenase subunit beta